VSVPDLQFAPLPSFSTLGEQNHVVQFYESDAYLLDRVTSYIAPGLAQGDACVVIATPAHLQDLEDRLAASGLDMERLTRGGQYLPLDARALLMRMMHGRHLEAEVFRELIGDVINTALEGYGRVRAFGEMVALLWAEDNTETALHLEECWNDLQKTHDFSLVCGYPMSGFSRETLADMHEQVCGHHTQVIPAESYHALESVDDRLRAIAGLQQRAASLQAEIAERKAIEAELHRALAMRDEFFSAMAHDFRTPLTVLRTQAQLLQRRLRDGNLDNETTLRSLARIEDRSRMLAQLVDELLDVSQLRAGEDLQLHRETIDLVALVEEITTGCRETAGDREIRFNHTDSKIDGFWDRVRLCRVLENIIGNAIKYSPGGGEIVVTLHSELRPDGPVALLAVQDHGIGIEPEDLPHIFEPFYRGKRGELKIEGTGLGLAGVRHIVEQHGGTITVESDRENGTTFRLCLPTGNRA
jgi:signal transduction histidine kinase